MNRRRLVATALGLALLPSALPAAPEAPEPVVELRWALGAVPDGGDRPTGIRRDTALEAGTRLKFLVEPISGGSVYLILLDSDEAIHVLFRERVAGGAHPAGEAEPTYVPPGRHWFRLDDRTGRETFFLLASAEPLGGLEALLDELEAADEAGKSRLGPQIVAEIRRVNREHRRFARPVEKPVMIGGRTRGEPSESTIDELAVEVSAERFYGKTITIDH